MHDCASILDSIAKKTSCFHYFSHGASRPTSPFIDFYTCFTTVLCVNAVPHSRRR